MARMAWHSLVVAAVLSAVPDMVHAQRLSDLQPSGIVTVGAAATSEEPGVAASLLPPLARSVDAPRRRVWPTYALIGAAVGAGLVIGHVVLWCRTESKTGCKNDGTVGAHLMFAVPVGALAGGAVGALIGGAVDAARSSRPTPEAAPAPAP